MALKKIDGVDSVTVSLNKGVADITLKPGNRVTVEQIVKAIRDNGFTPRGTDVQVAGTVIERDGKLALTVAGLDRVYLLADHPEAKGKLDALRKEALGKPVTVYGHLPEEKESSPEPRTLRLQNFILAGK